MNEGVAFGEWVANGDIHDNKDLLWAQLEGVKRGATGTNQTKGFLHGTSLHMCSHHHVLFT